VSLPTRPKVINLQIHILQLKKNKKLNQPEGKNCSDKNCVHQHPNPKWATIHVENLKMEFLKKENQKSYIKFLMPKFQNEMSKKFCELYILDKHCFDPECHYQHLSLDVDSVSFKNEVKIEWAPSEEAYRVEEIWKSHSSNPKACVINNVQIISNKRLQNKFSKRQSEMQGAKVIWGFHGTPDQNIEIIAKDGFSKNHQIRNAYGVGTYFAHDPNISVGYCASGKRMILAMLLVSTSTEEQLFSKENGYYIIPETDGALPLYIITFQ
jgi:hypothetical protein